MPPEGETKKKKGKTETDAKDPANHKVHLSVIMSIMWIARLTRDDVHFVTTYFASRSHIPTMACLVAATRVLKYLQSTQDGAFVFKGGEQIKGIAMRVHCDASQGIHADGKEHGGIFGTMGSGYVRARSTKVKMFTLSADETEQYVMCNVTTYALWGRMMLKTFDLHNATKPCMMYQGNAAAIGMTRRNGMFARTKHIMIRGNFMREAVERGDIKWYLERTHNLAPDVLTKCLPRATMLRHMAKMVMRDIQPEEGKE
jgi:hypothetical protein